MKVNQSRASPQLRVCLSDVAYIYLTALSLLGVGGGGQNTFSSGPNPLYGCPVHFFGIAATPCRWASYSSTLRWFAVHSSSRLKKTNEFFSRAVNAKIYRNYEPFGMSRSTRPPPLRHITKDMNSHKYSNLTLWPWSWTFTV